MLETSLIGRKFQSNIGISKYTCVAVYVTSGNLILVGEGEKGNLNQFNVGQVTLMEIPRGVGSAVEDLKGVI